MSKYDYLIVGAGLFGAVAAYRAARSGKKALVIDRRPHTGGNAYCEEREGIRVHKYGAHIFHTSNREVWEFVNRFVEFNNYINSPVANYKGKLYNLPFNMNTFYAMWGVTTPAQAAEMIDRQRHEAGISEPRNLEEQAISLVGIDIYERLVKGYTEKQWGRDATQLPAFIIKRLPVRFTFDNNYFNDRYQGIPMGGYTKMIENMLEGTEVRCGVEYAELVAAEPDIADRVIYCGPIDAFYDYKLGTLDYRSLRFEHSHLAQAQFQPVTTVNYPNEEAYTRITEFKHLTGQVHAGTSIVYEYPCAYEPEQGLEPYYPLFTDTAQQRYAACRAQLACFTQLIPLGRLAEYRYFDMDDAVDNALQTFRTRIENGN